MVETKIKETKIMKVKNFLKENKATLAGIGFGVATTLLGVCCVNDAKEKNKKKPSGVNYYVKPLTDRGLVMLSVTHTYNNGKEEFITNSTTNPANAKILVDQLCQAIDTVGVFNN